MILIPKFQKFQNRLETKESKYIYLNLDSNSTEYCRLDNKQGIIFSSTIENRNSKIKTYSIISYDLANCFRILQEIYIYATEIYIEDFNLLYKEIQDNLKL